VGLRQLVPSMTDASRLRELMLGAFPSLGASPPA